MHMKYTRPSSLGCFPASPTSPIPRVPPPILLFFYFFDFYIPSEISNPHIEGISSPSQSWLSSRAHLGSVRAHRISQYKSLTLYQAIPHSCTQNVQYQKNKDNPKT